MRNIIGDFVGHPRDPRTYVPSEAFVMNSLVGLELELEETDVYVDDLDFWSKEEDASLRGIDAYEYVFTNPLSGVDLENAIWEFNEAVADLPHPPVTSERTSTHVHIDVRDLTPEQLTKFIAVYFTVEPLLFNYVEESRSKNNYCIQMSKANIDFENTSKLASLGKLNEYQATTKLNSTLTRANKYSALNLAAIARFGSAEFRHHQGEWRHYKLVEWINICLCIKKFAVTSDINLDNMPYYVSSTGIAEYVEAIFGEYANRLTYVGMGSDIMKQVRLIQPFTMGLLREEYLVYRAKFQLRFGTEAPNKELYALWKENNCEVLDTTDEAALAAAYHSLCSGPYNGCFFDRRDEIGLLNLLGMLRAKLTILGNG
jgi:hypothetical protein